MSIELYLIAISGILLLILISIRYFRIAYAKKETTDFLVLSDRKIKRFSFVSYKILCALSDIVSDFFRSIPHRLLHLVHSVLSFLSRKTKRWIDLIKGKNIQTNKGAVSLYLRQLDNREENNK